VSTSRNGESILLTLDEFRRDFAGGEGLLAAVCVRGCVAQESVLITC
jgi:hypothetical protein